MCVNYRVWEARSQESAQLLFLLRASRLTRAPYRVVTATLPLWFPVVLLRLVRIRKLPENGQNYGRNERGVRTEGSVRIRLRI